MDVILILADETAYRDVLRDILHLEGFVTRTRPTGRMMVSTNLSLTNEMAAAL